MPSPMPLVEPVTSAVLFFSMEVSLREGRGLAPARRGDVPRVVPNR